jgi:uncharacterized protein (DUF1810 family)
MHRDAIRAMMSDFDLDRFVLAQDANYAAAVGELKAGRKRSHWMWYVFPQIAGLGRSEMARRYAISGLTEARAYLAHPVLGPRLRHCTQIVAHHDGLSAHEIFGSPDDLKFRSCLTLFAQAAPEETVFAAALHKYFGGKADPQTVEILS